MRPPVSLYIIFIVSLCEVIAHVVPVVTNLIIPGRSNAIYASKDFHPRKISSVTITQPTIRRLHTYVLIRGAIIIHLESALPNIATVIWVSKEKTTGGVT